MTFINNIKEKIRGKDLRLIYPEGSDIRILMATSRLKEENLLTPVLVGDPIEIESISRDHSINLEGMVIIDPKNFKDRDALADILIDRRKGIISSSEAYSLIDHPNYFGALMVEAGHVDGMVSGAVYTTADMVIPAMQIIKTMPGINKPSGLFVLLKREEQYLMADCAINPVINAEDMAEIAILTDRTARQFGIDPKIGMLSYSTKGSAQSDEIDKVQSAVLIARELNPDIIVDGEFQFDAAVDMIVANRKAPGSKVAGQTNAFIFPNLTSANIGYKIAEKLGGFEAIGPILQGLNKPINELSRGCSEEDIYALSILTGAQVLL